MKEGCALFSGKDWEITIKNNLSAQNGDLVRIELSGRDYLTAGAVVFILPLLLMTAAYFLGRLFLAEGMAVLFAFVGFGIGITFAYLIGRGKGADKFRYRIIEILPKESDAREN